MSRVICAACDSTGCSRCAYERAAQALGVTGLSAEDLELFDLRREVRRLKEQRDALVIALALGVHGARA